jgi:hypothetical protein
LRWRRVAEELRQTEPAAVADVRARHDDLAIGRLDRDSVRGLHIDGGRGNPADAERGIELPVGIMAADDGLRAVWRTL